MAEDVGGIQASVVLDDSDLDAKLARLRSSIGQLEAEMQALQGRMQQGTGDTKAMADTLDVLSAAHARLTDRAATMATATHQIHMGLDGVGKASSSAAREMMVLGQYADDLQSKSITAAEGMETLGKATSRTAEEAARLDSLKREPRHADGQRADRSGEEPRGDKEPVAFVDPMDGGEQGHRNAGPMASLRDRLAHLTQVEQGGGGMLGGPAYEPSTKAVAGDDSQFRKLQDIGKTLEEIRKLYAATKTIGVKRRR